MFIEFANSNDCQAAQLSLTGRKFSNRVVVTRSLITFHPGSPFFYPPLSSVTTTRRNITEGSFEQRDEEAAAAEEECGFIFSCFTTQCAIEIRTFVVLHYYISIFVVTVDFFVHPPTIMGTVWVAHEIDP